MGLEVTTDISAVALARYDMVIDVRSPGEFAEDHIPGAVNLPVLTDAERAEVGTVYVQTSRFWARRMGAAYVARNIARHLETALADREGGFAPLIYCWRGGMRSNAMATILSQVGWRTAVLDGGYRTYRRYVTARLYDGSLPHRILLLEGHTGTAKTELLGRLASHGAQVLDLEGLAAHRGSLFGGYADRPQPSQKLFESRLLTALDALDPERAVVIEAESSKIGDRMIPPALWTRLDTAPYVELQAEPAARAQYLVHAYQDIVMDRSALERALERLPIHPSPAREAAWRALADAGQFAELSQALMALHYDPAYVRARKKHPRRLVEAIPIVPVQPASQEAAAETIIRIIATLDAERPSEDSAASNER
jgi:tRNA 2-selenouridine synthase